MKEKINQELKKRAAKLRRLAEEIIKLPLVERKEPLLQPVPVLRYPKK